MIKHCDFLLPNWTNKKHITCQGNLYHHKANNASKPSEVDLGEQIWEPAAYHCNIASQVSDLDTTLVKSASMTYIYHGHFFTRSFDVIVAS